MSTVIKNEVVNFWFPMNMLVKHVMITNPQGTGVRAQQPMTAYVRKWQMWKLTSTSTYSALCCDSCRLGALAVLHPENLVSGLCLRLGCEAFDSTVSGSLNERSFQKSRKSGLKRGMTWWGVRSPVLIYEEFTKMWSLKRGSLQSRVFLIWNLKRRVHKKCSHRRKIVFCQGASSFEI